MKELSEVKKNYIIVISGKNPIRWKFKIFNFQKLIFTRVFFSLPLVTLLPHRVENIKRHVPDPQSTPVQNLVTLSQKLTELELLDLRRGRDPLPPPPIEVSQFFFVRKNPIVCQNSHWKFGEVSSNSFGVITIISFVTNRQTDKQTDRQTDGKQTQAFFVLNLHRYDL